MMKTSEPRTLVTHPELRSHESFPFFKTLGERPKNLLERLLSLFADVRAGEGVGALLLAINIFLILAASYLVRNARTVLVLTEGRRPFGLSGAEQQAALSGVMAVILIGLVPLYGWLASRVRRMVLMTTTTLFFAMNLVVFFFLGGTGLPLGAAFYIWAGIFNLFVLAQFWGFANDLYTEGQGRRLFPMIGVGASVGAVIGAVSIRPLVQYFRFDSFTVMLVAAAVLLLALGITAVANRRETAQAAADPLAVKTNEEPLGKEGGFSLVLKDRYLMWIGVLVILLNVVNSTGNFLMYNLVETHANTIADVNEKRQYVALFQGSFDTLVNWTALILQLFVTSRALRLLGVRGSLFVMPIIALVNYSIIAVAPILAIIRVGKIMENSCDYSIQNTLRQVVFLPTTREAKYKAKAAIDTFGQRTGDVLAAAVVIVGSSFLGLPSAILAGLNVGLTAVWLWVAGQIAREHRKKTV